MSNFTFQGFEDSSSFHSKIYNEFKELHVSTPEEIVDFFEEHREDIPYLTFHESFELQIAYVDALFAVGAYENLLSACDNAIECAFERNIQFFHGEDIFRKLLFRKAAAYYNLSNYKKAKSILMELLRIQPKDFSALLFLRKCIYYNPSATVRMARFVSLILFLFTGAVIFGELLYFGWGSGQDVVESYIEAFRNGIFLFGWSVLILSEGFFRWNIYQETKKMINKIEIAKANKKKTSRA